MKQASFVSVSAFVFQEFALPSSENASLGGNRCIINSLHSCLCQKSRLLDMGKIISLCFCVDLHFPVGSKELTRLVSLHFFLVIAIEVFVK